MKKLPFRSSLSRRLTAVLGVLALILCEQQSNAASQNWTGGSAVDGNWGTALNWNGAVPGSTSVLNSADVATFNAAIANTWGNSALNPIVINSTTQNISGLTFTLAAGNYFIGSTAGNRLLLSSGGTIQIAAALTATNAIETINAPLQIQGASGATYTFTNLSANGTGVGAGTLNFGGGITGVATTGNTTTLTLAGTNTNDNTISGIIGDGSAGGKMALTKNITVGTWVLSGANTYTGATNVNGGLLKVNGAAGSISTSGSISIGLTSSGVGSLTSATLQLDNSTGNVDRIGNAVPVTLFNLGELALIGNTTTSTTETIGGLSVGTGSRSSAGTITLSGTSASVLTTLASSSFTRVNNSTALIRGTSLGQQATNATRLTLGSTAGLTFVGTTTANGATPGTTKDVKIVPYLLGDTSAAGNGSSFVTYDTTGGLRPLAASEYTTLSAGYTAPASKGNVIAFNGTLTTASPTVNSLLFNTASQTLNGSGTLTVQSGAIAGVAATVAIGSGFTSVTLGNGTWNEGVLTASSGNTLTINAPLAVTGGSGGVLTKTGAGTVIFNAGSSYDAVTNVTQGILSIAHNNALGSTVGGTVVNGPSGGRLAIQNNITVAEPLTLIDQGPGNGNVLSVQSGQNTLTGAITASGSNRWSISGASLTVTGGITPTSGNIFFIADATTNGTLKFTTNPLNLGSGGTFYHDTPGLDILAVSGNTWGATSVVGSSSAGQSIRTDVANALPSTTTVTIGNTTNTATLDLNGNSQSIVSLASGGTGGTRTLISANAATLTITGSTSTDYAGTITGALGLTISKSGGTQTLSGANTHTGDTLVSGATLALALGNVNALQGSTLDTGTSGAQAVTFTAGTNTYNLGGLKGADALAIGANSISVGANNQSTSFTGVIGTGTGDLTKVGTGALTLGGANSYTGATTVNSGTLILDYTASDTGKLSETAVTGILTLGTATLQLDRSTGASGSHTEAVLSTTLNGAASITRGTGSTAVLQMNAITRNAGGSLNLGAASIASTDTNNTNGILGPWATINGTDWATSVDSGAADTLITAYTAYTDVQRLTPGTIANGSTTNVRLIEGSGSAGNIALGAATTTINTLNQSTSGGTSAATIDATSKTLAVNGILVGSGAGALTIGTTAGSGTLQTATSGGELVIHHYGSNNLTLNSVIANNTSASGLTQSGTGTTVLAGTNTFTGKTLINGGKLSIAAETGLGSNPGSFTADQLTLNGGTLVTTATLAIDDTNRGITLGAAGGTFEVSTGTTTIAATSIIAGSGGFTKTGAGQLTLSGTANTYTGPTTISAGILSVSSLGNGGANSALGAATRANTNLVFDGGTLQYTGTTANGTSDRFFTINAGKTATFDVSATAFGISGTGTTVLTLGGGAGGTTGALTKTGLGTLSLTGGSDYTGATTVSTGTLLIGANNALGSTAGTTTVASGAMLQLQGSITVAEAITINGNGTSNSGSLRSDSGVNVLTGLLTLASTTTRIRSDGGSLTLSGGVSRPSGISTDTFQVIVNGSGFISFDTNPINVGAGRVELVGVATSQARLAVTGNTYGLLQVGWNSVTRLDVANALNASAVLEMGTHNTNQGSSTLSATTGALDLFGNSQTVGELRTGAGSLLSGVGTRTIGSVAPATLTVNQSTTSTYDGTLTGALALTKSGTGTLILSGASTTTGKTLISGGKLSISAETNLGGNPLSFAADQLTLDGGTLLATAGFGIDDSSRGITLGSSGGTFEVSTGTLNIAATNPITGAGALTKTGAGAIALGGANTFTGATTVSNGTLLLDYTASNTSKLSDTAVLTLGSATLQLDRSTGASGSHTETVLSTTLNGSASITRATGSTAVLQMNAITRSSGGSLNLGAANIASTDTLNTNGILGAWATINGTDFAMNSTNAADGLITAYTAYTDVQRLTPGTIADGSTTNVRLIEGSGSAGNIALGATTTTINTLNQSTSGGSSAATIDAASKTLAVNGILIGSGAGALTIGTTAGSGTLQTATAGGELVIQHYGSNNLTLNSIIANNTSASGLTQSGTGTTVLAGTNTFTGKTLINGGKLSIAAETGLGSNPGSFTADQLTLNGGTLLTTATLAIDDTNRGITLGAAGGTFEVSTGTTTIAATSVIAGSGSLTKTGTGTLTLSGANTFTGKTLINAGKLSIAAETALGSNPGSFTADQLTLNGGTLLSTATFSIDDANRGITLGTSGGTIEVSTGTLTVAATNLIAGSGSLTKTGTGGLTLSGANTFTGDTVVSAGTLTLSNINALQNSTLDTGTSGSQAVAFANSTATLGGLKGADDLAIGSTPTVLSVGNNNQSTSFTGAITGTGGSLIKIGTGALTLGGSNSYTGATTVNGGTLILDYTATNTSKLADGAVLTLGSGTLQLDRSTSASGTHTEIVLSTTLNGAASITRGTGSTAVLQMNAIARNAGGTLNLGAASIASTDTTNTNGILGAWATINGTDFAMNSTNAADGLITAYTAYTDVQRLTPGTIADGSTTNVRIIEGSGSAGNIALGAATTTINTLNQSTSGGSSAAIIDSASRTLRTNSILVGSGAGALTIGTAAGSGTLSTATSGGDLLIQHYGSNNLTINSVIANNTSASNLVKTGSGTLVLAGTNTYTGTTSILEGTVSVASLSNGGANGVFGNTAATSAIVLGSAATSAKLQFTGGTSMSTNRDFVLGAAGGVFESLISPTSSTATISGNISGSGSLIKTGSGVFVISGVNTYTGQTIAREGFLNIGSASAIAGGGTLIIGDNTATASTTGITINLDNVNGATFANNITFVTNGQSQSKVLQSRVTNTTLSGTITVAPNVTFGAGANQMLTINGKLTGTSPGVAIALMNNGTGTVLLTNEANDFNDGVSNSLTVTRGTLLLQGNDTAVGGVAGILGKGTGALQMNGSSSNTGENAQILTNGAYTIARAINMNQGGAGSASFNTVGGNTANASTFSGAITLASGANTTHQLTAASGGAVTFSNVISGTATNGLNKIGTGTVIFSGANTYSGATNVTAGALQVGSNGVGQTGTGAVTVQTSSTIFGSGVIRGSSFTAQSGSTLYAGDSTADNSFGTLNFTPASSGGILSLQSSIVLGIGTANNLGSIDGSFGGNDVGTAGYISYVNHLSRSQGLGAGSHDLLSFNNPAGGGSTSLSFLTTTGSLQVLGSGFTAEKGQIFNLIDWGTLVTTNFTGFNLGSNYRDGSGDNGTSFDLPTLSGGLVWDVSQFTTSGIIVVVPEPSRALFLLLGVAGLLMRRRRKN
jgi:fibronectin-binding autotransporter adhesin